MTTDYTKSRTANFSELEKRSLCEILVKHPVIEEKRKSGSIEASKKKAWLDVVQCFNSNENVSPRTEIQLKVSLKDIHFLFCYSYSIQLLNILELYCSVLCVVLIKY